MLYRGDLHIHTCLSPCGDKEMIPPNIINMAKIQELSFIAITDHNTCRNTRVFVELGQAEGIMVFPGLEVQSIEDVHLLTLFPTVEDAEEMEKIIWDNLPFSPNPNNFFGEQIVVDKQGNQASIVERLLLVSTNLRIREIIAFTNELGGIVIPAHINRPHFSILANLGFIPKDYNFKTVEITRGASEEVLKAKNPHLKGFRMIKSSDAHYLKDMIIDNQKFELENLSFQSLKNYLTSNLI
jgi:PHP family Zn ribbon phosphoesterase